MIVKSATKRTAEVHVKAVDSVSPSSQHTFPTVAARRTPHHGCTSRLFHRLAEATRQLRPVGVAIGFAVLIVTVVALLAGGHADIIKSALAPNVKASDNGDVNVANLAAGANLLASDALYLLVPTVSLACAAGGIAWACGSQRGQGIVVGAVVAGVMVVCLRTIIA